MYVSRKYRFVFFAQARTASHAVGNALVRSGICQQKGHHNIRFEDPAFHAESGYYFWALVRNHFDTLVSWRYKERDSSDFSRWLDYWMNLRNGLMNPPERVTHKLYWQYLPLCTHVYRYEDGPEKVTNHVLNMLGAPGVRLELENKTPRRPVDYRDEYTDETVKQVCGHYGPELMRLGYRFDPCCTPVTTEPKLVLLS